jgi:hypothetical protein
MKNQYRTLIQRELFESCGGRCYYCGIYLPDDWQIDHMTPTAQAGEDVYANLVASCQPCNASKGNRTAEEFRRAILRRGLSRITEALENLSKYTVTDNDFHKAVETLSEAENNLAKSRVSFYGEVAPIPRKFNPIFSENSMIPRKPEGSDDAIWEMPIEEAGEGINELN